MPCVNLLPRRRTHFTRISKLIDQNVSPSPLQPPLPTSSPSPSNFRIVFVGDAAGSAAFHATVYRNIERYPSRLSIDRGLDTPLTPQSHPFQIPPISIPTPRALL